MKNIKSNNRALHRAKQAKNDEFYTQYCDVEQEIESYAAFNNDVFKDKTVLLPCDDPERSNFTLYFIANFKRYGLKKLISTSYTPEKNGKGKLLIIDNPETTDAHWQYLEGDGDFRSPEITALRDEADFIITNPPFSLFREFMAWLIESDKQFVVIGNMNAITYKEIFPLIKNNKTWLGVFNGAKEYRQPNGTIQKMGNTLWFTNVEHGRRHQPLDLMTMADNLIYNESIKKDPNSYQKYDNYDAIEIPKTNGIPSDYKGVMGVPISFLDKYCPEQFEIIGMAHGEMGQKLGVSANLTDDECAILFKENKAFRRGFVCYKDKDGKLVVPYMRILIKHINPQKETNHAK